MKRPFIYWILILLDLCSFSLSAQPAADTLYQTRLIYNLEYGTAINYAGSPEVLSLDLMLPTNDEPGVCGRPLMVVVHGGAFIAGSKLDAVPQRLLKNFAQMGYAVAAINYRLVFFHPASERHCNLDGWDCLNAADTAEWYRAIYRAMQDTKGAIRFLVGLKDSFQIDPNNVFVVGESAGAITALQTTFIDHASKKPIEAGALDSANRPNAIYNSCNLGRLNIPSRAEMNLNRPDLGSVKGTLNLAHDTFTIRGVGAFYGGMMQDYLTLATGTTAPHVYLFHQPNDLLVPYKRNRILQGLAQCATEFPFNCVWLPHRPYILGSSAIARRIEAMPASPQKPIVWFDSTRNQANCALQATNSSLVGHAIDNYWLRIGNMANFFLSAIDTSGSCLSDGGTGIGAIKDSASYRFYPNPAKTRITLTGLKPQSQIRFYDLTGRLLYQVSNQTKTTLHLPIARLAAGLYYLEIVNGELGSQKMKLLVQ